jgi:DEAD/DEAH box helicase domain-containing protein
MIPSLLAQDVAKSLREFIVAGFETDTWPFAGKFEQLVNSHSTSAQAAGVLNNGDAFIKGPYVSINLPFAKRSDRHDFFAGFKTEHSPFVHQQQAWTSLRSGGAEQSTVVATGTGSGKTECFLYPLLDHCQRKPKPGIKAIIIYPMNALAGDQAKRFADVIHSTPELKGKVRVGLFVGGASDEKLMGEKHVITCKNTLRKSPPDILLTNYKMLDFLLMRPKDQVLWQHNTPDSLKYLVVDELHTFDGAQGSDLAMLIRRLKARLGVKKENLICVGTSATLGSESQMDDLASYAGNIFDTPFDRNSIIGESREGHDEFLGMIEYMLLDPSFTPEQLRPDFYASLDEHLSAQVRLFFGDEWLLVANDMASRQALGQRLRKHPLMHNLLYIARRGPVAISELLPAIQKQVPAQLKANVADVLASLLALLSHARGGRYPGEPFVTVRVQLWARELRRIVARVGTDTPQKPVHLQFSDDLKSKAKNELQGDIYLPVVQCRECHTTAWLTTVEQGDSCIEQDLRKIYTRFFASDKRVRVLLPLKGPEYQPPTKGIVRYLCSDCGQLQTSAGECKACQEKELVAVFEPDLNKSVRRGGIPTFESQRMCPVCQASSSLILFGARAASLSAVAIHQMFANKINDDKKLIAFSDSVQDAAHRAGFFSARTWQNNIRMALAKAVTHYCDSQNKNISLTELFNYLPHYWLQEPSNAERLTELNFITQFIPPNMQTYEDYLTLKEGGKLDNPGRLISQISKRLAWEALSEFGIKSLIGRSLERTGVAAMYWNPELIEDAGQALVDTCRENMGYSLSLKNAQYMLWGIALRMKRQGAVYDDVLRGFIEDGGQYFVLNKLPFLPRFGDFSTVPIFPAEAKERKFDCVYPKKQSTWYSRWVQQLLVDDQLVDNNFISDLLKVVMQSLVKSGLLLEIETRKEHKAWALNPEHLLITTALGAVRLRRGDIGGLALGEPTANEANSAYGSWYVPEEWVDAIAGMPSLEQVFIKDNAVAIYEPNAHPRKSMYRDFYIHGEIKRVIGHEHTGLLERGYREALEQRFMAKSKDRKDWYENLLSATPTLEMGIDIGDLSSVLLCSVPPSQANYLQRAGRGGRKDGNSFVLTLANGHPHDLYFYADPIKMLAGDVQAPAIFLNASMVLRRQLLAFCFDQWGVKFKGQQVIPGSMQAVLDTVENADLKRFPYTLLDFIGKHRDELWERFNSLLDRDVLPDTRDKLKAYLLGTTNEEEALNIYVLSRIKQVVVERKNLIRHQKDLESELRGLKKKPKDEARDELEQELTTELEGIKRLKTDLNRKDTLNFLTDDGLLPNYAFPEEGTTLRSVIFRRLSKPIALEGGKTTSYDSKVFEYTRPAHAALSELAPESVFYASNRKVKIERIEMARGENLEYWRLCPACSYSARIQGVDKEANCPRCANPMWANVSQLMPMVKLRQVYANTKEDDAFIGDDSDTREPTFYNKQMLIDFDPSDIIHAYAMKTDTRPFGFEFIKKALFKEINFGKQGGSDQMLNVAGVELARPGFRLCKECGMVQHRRNQPEHMFKCSYRNAKNESGDEQCAAGIIDCLYLYRQYESEAVRILMPKLSLAQREEQIQSFVAAIQLGLKSRFGGKVDHLNITVSDEPISGSEERTSYLVLYDTVPGGTGYLHTLLADPKNLMATLDMSRQIMAACECQNSPEMDGCYNCLYAYKNSYGMENTSRTMALTMLNDILDENVELAPVEHLGTINKNVWADSELESRFPEALQALNQSALLDGARIRTTKDIVNGKVGFKLEIGELMYSVEPHARLGKEQGVAYPCEPDFLISLDRETEEKIQVAVFLDGYSYHKDIVHEDLMKRQGIFLSSNMLTWSLTWHDVNHIFAGSEVKIPNVLRENTANAPMPFIQRVSEAKGLKAHTQIAELSPIVMLLKFLSAPCIDTWRSYAMLRALCWLDQSRMKSPDEKHDFENHAHSWPSQYLDSISNADLVFCCSNKLTDKHVNMSVFIAGEQAAITELNPAALVLAAVFDPINTDDELTKTTWQKLLQLLNIGQFLPKFFAGTRLGIENGDFAQLEWGKQSDVMESTEWDRVAKISDENIRDLIYVLASESVPIPEVGYELVNSKGAGVGEAELAWEDLKIAFMLDGQLEEGHRVFEKYGWEILTLDDDTDVLMNKLRGQR